MSVHPGNGTPRGPNDLPRSTSGGLALPPRQAAPPSRPAVALAPKANNRARMVASIAGAAVAGGLIGRAIAARGSS
jgi:hypothetical protein